MKKVKQAEIYQLKIALKYVRPAIWRRIQVRRDVTLAELHSLLRTSLAGSGQALNFEPTRVATICTELENSVGPE